MKQVWQSEDGKSFDTEKECLDHEQKMQNILLRQKWIEQNDISLLFGNENQNYQIGADRNNPEIDYKIDNKIIFRSSDNNYFNDLDIFKLHEKELRKRDLTKIIDRTRVWRSDKRSREIRYFLTEEECLLYESKAFNGKIFDTEEERIVFENEEQNEWISRQENGEHDLLRQRWIEQNDISFLFGNENQNYQIGADRSNPEIDYKIDNKIIFRSSDNNYFNDLDIFKLHEKELQKKDLTKIIDRTRVWRSDKRSWKIRYFLTEEECLLYERKAFNGEIFDTEEERIVFENEQQIKRYKKCEEGKLESKESNVFENEEQIEWISEEYEDSEIKAMQAERDVYGVNWGEEQDNSDWEEEMQNRDPFEGSPDYE